MAQLNIPLMRLQYEILNTPLSQLAAEAGVPLSILSRDAESLGWKQLWPDLPTLDAPESEPTTLNNMQDALSRAEAIALETEQYLDTARTRLKVYSLAKETMLAHRYLALECGILDAARDILEDGDYTAQTLKQLSGVYKDLSSGLSMSGVSGISIGEDDNGIPTVVIKDLSGGK